jgi:hypothetical protein
MKALIDGDIWIDANGYQRHDNDKYVHRSVVETALGRELRGSELVHHVDYDKANNSPSNLVVCPDASYHQLLHARQRILELGGTPETHAYCSYHKGLHKISEFSYRKDRGNGLHNMCRRATNEYRKIKGLNRSKFDWKARLGQQYRRIFKANAEDKICEL